MHKRSVLLVLALVGLASGAARAEGVEPIGTAPTAIELSRVGDAQLESGTALAFRNPGAASSRLLLPHDAARAISCSPDGSTTSRSRPGQFLLGAGAELRCTAEPGRYKVTAITAEGGAVQERSGRILVR
jgi:hypothetical protein